MPGLAGVWMCLVMYWGGLVVFVDWLEGGKGIYYSSIDILKGGFYWLHASRLSGMCMAGVWIRGM